MKKLYLVCFLFLFFVLSGCEKPIIDDEIGLDDETEQTDKNKDADNEQDDNSNDSDNNDNGDDEEIETPDNYEEKDIEDGNDDSHNNGSGRSVEDALTVSEFIFNDIENFVFVKGYIVGACTKSIENADFEPPFDYDTAILLADKKGETDIDKIISIQLKKGKLRDKFNLIAHPENYGRKVYFFGSKKVYLGIYGMKDDIGASGFLD